MHDGCYTPFIEGEWVRVGCGTRDLGATDPATGEEIARIRVGSAETVDHAVGSAEAAYPAWRRRTAAERTRTLFAIAEALRQKKPQLAEVERRDSGKSTSGAAADVEGAAAFFEYYGGLAAAVEGSTIPGRPEVMALTLREPYGVTGHIIPWNFPLLTAARSIAPALAVGNTAILKPSEEASLSCLELGPLAVEAGLPAGVLNVVPGFGDDVGDALARHPGVPRLTFTGSVETGRKVLVAAATHFAYTTVELGGKSPNIVFGDADMESTIVGVTRSILSHAGQICSAGSRLLVEAAYHDDVVEEVVGAVRRYSEDPDAIDPLISERQWKRVASLVSLGISEGAQLREGTPPGAPGSNLRLRPIVFDEVSLGMTIAQEEIFGPVLSVMTFDDEGDAIRIGNGTSYGLAAGIWTRDLGKALRVASELEAGTIYINSYFAGGPELPFGGYKNSGFGREKGFVALHEYTRLKSIAINMG